MSAYACAEIYSSTATIPSSVSYRDKDEYTIGSSSNNNNRNRNSEVDITVIGARLDPICLAKSTTKTTTGQKSRMKRQRIEYGYYDEPVFFDASDMSVKDSRATTTTKTKTTKTHYHHHHHEQEENDAAAAAAIQFDLSISFNGRTYTATRTMPRIIKLHNDLKRELSKRREQLRRRLRWHNHHHSSGSHHVDDDVKPSHIRKTNTVKNNNNNKKKTPLITFSSLIAPYLRLQNSDDGFISDDDSTADTNISDDYIDDSDQFYDDIHIPDLPGCSITENDSNGLFTTGGGGASSMTACRGFTMLYTMLNSYRHAMERWLHNVSTIFPPDNSPALAYFLWEPLSQDKNRTASVVEEGNAATTTTTTTTMITTLPPINETGDDDSVEDDND